MSGVAESEKKVEVSNVFLKKVTAFDLRRRVDKWFLPAELVPV